MGQTVRNGWIGVDLDGTLASYDGWVSEDHIGPPVPSIVERIKQVLELGFKVKIFTARVACTTPKREIVTDLIIHWLRAAGLPDLEVVCAKDTMMIELWDDRCVAVESNTGRFLTPSRVLV